ncbi:MAG: hypothetical protein AABZ02_01030, partial [Bacteroidota bacterium]
KALTAHNYARKSQGFITKTWFYLTEYKAFWRECQEETEAFQARNSNGVVTEACCIFRKCPNLLPQVPEKNFIQKNSSLAAR